ncbi:MAG: murein biosynthesis integral membrane protein MurJ [Candidatus Dormibacterales bacterium]
MSADSPSLEPGPKAVGVAGFAGLTLAGLVLDRLFALALTVLMSAIFGVRKELDTYLLAVAGPALLAAMLGDLVYSLLLPEFVQAKRQSEKTDERWNTAVWAIVALALITALYMACWTGGVNLASAGSQRDLLLRLGLLTSPMIFLGGLGALGATILIAQQRYVAASLRIPIASITAVIAFVVLSRIDRGIEVLAISVITGALVAAVVMALSVVRLLGRPVVTISPAWSMRLLHRLGGTSVAQVISALVAQAQTPIERLVGFNLGAGVISSLNYGRVLASPPLLIGSSIATASYPRFVAMKADGEPRRYEALGRSIGMVVFLLLPLTVLIAGLAAPLVQLVYHRGAFDEQAVTRTTVAVTILAGALVPSAVSAVLTRFLYAERASDRVAWASIATLAVYSLAAIVGAQGFGYVGLAVASTGSYLFLMASLLVMVRRGSPRALAFLPWRNLGRSALASAVTGVAVVAIAMLGSSHTGHLAVLLVIISAGIAGGLVYLVASWAMRTPELVESLGLARSWITRLSR